MQSTPASLLERLRLPDEQAAWERFVKLYMPLLYYWAHRVGLQESDAADLVQDVLTILLERLPEFEYDRQQSFRGWLRTILLNRWRNLRRQRVPRPLEDIEADLADPAGAGGADVLEEVEYRSHVVGRAMELMQTDFQLTTWKAFWECAVVGRPAAEVAAESV